MWSAIKTILNNKSDKCLIIEEGTPKYVILTYDGYQHLQNQKNSSMVKENPDIAVSVKEVNGEIQNIREDQENGTLRIEDLPF